MALDVTDYTDRRGLMIVRVDFDLIQHSLRTGRRLDATVAEGLPDDAELIRTHDGAGGERTPPRSLALVFASIEWPELGNGDPIPELRPVLLDPPRARGPLLDACAEASVLLAYDPPELEEARRVLRRALPGPTPQPDPVDELRRQANALRGQAVEDRLPQGDGTVFGKPLPSVCRVADCCSEPEPGRAFCKSHGLEAPL